MWQTKTSVEYDFLRTAFGIIILGIILHFIVISDIRFSLPQILEDSRLPNYSVCMDLKNKYVSMYAKINSLHIISFDVVQPIRRLEIIEF